MSTFATRRAPMFWACALLLPPLLGVSAAQAATPAELLAAYTKAAGAPPSAERGQKLFTTKGPGDFGWSCASCHTDDPTKVGKHAASDKPVPPLAPSANKQRFTTHNKVEFHFNLNCKDVLNRECTSAEKADVMAWLLSFK
jgi:mono/diheme cytochrome c family protein